MRKKYKNKILKMTKIKNDNQKEIKRIKRKRPINIKKIEKKNKSINFQITEIKRKKRMVLELIIVLVILFLLIIRIGYIQIIKGEELKTLAYIQQTMDRKINPKRGTIYDATGETKLAVSATVETITVNPTNVSDENKEKVAKALSDIFELDYEKVLKKVKKRSSIENIIKKVEKEKTDKLRIWMQENKISNGINIDEDTKRYYPYNNLASQIIGFCGSDNQGLDGIEARYNETLSGEQGKIEKLTDAKGGNLKGTGENYKDAIDGNDIILSIDAVVQGIAEKYLEEACIDNVCTDGGNIVIMNPKNGDVLAMAGYPNYNLNEPYTINSEELLNTWNTLEQSQKSTYLQQMWRNKAISDTYEPGSTFKLLTASASLEEGIASVDKEGEFCCTGGIEIAGKRIKCWRYYRPHGPESLRQALMNSCNPVFIGLGQKLGVKTYYSYLRKFGMLEKTGIDLYGEANSIFLTENKVGPVELATISFGQRFEVTPIQMIQMVGTIANNGDRVSPRIVKKIINSQTGETVESEIKIEENVISEETANNVLSMMESVVAEGTGKNAQVKGYAIGGKTGTSEDGVNTNKYVTSFIGVAPVSDTELVILITLYNPTGEGGHQGGGVAAPIASQVLGEVLPYLQVKKNEEEQLEVKIPNIEGITLKEAKKILEEQELGLEYEKNEDINNETIVKSQLPKSGIKVKKGTNIILEF